MAEPIKEKIKRDVTLEELNLLLQNDLYQKSSTIYKAPDGCVAVINNVSYYLKESK